MTIGLAVSREDIPVRSWVLPDNQHDSQCADQVQKNFNNWNLDRVVWVMDRGMTSDENQPMFQKACGQYIPGKKLRGKQMNETALAHPGRFKVVAENLHLREVVVGEGLGQHRYVIPYNPEQARMNRMDRENILERVSGEREALNRKKKAEA